MLAGIIQPSEGTVEVDGLISSLLTLGAGFDQELTGRENIRLAGAFLGHRRAARWRSGRPGSSSSPTSARSSTRRSRRIRPGMRARLGFSIATSVDPDILLLDEVLATGDEVFRAKSKARVLELVRQAKGVVLVTHDMNWVTEFCNRAILLEKGRIVAEGDPAEVVAIHKEHSRQAKAEREAAIAKALGMRRAARALPPDAAGSTSCVGVRASAPSMPSAGVLRRRPPRPDRRPLVSVARLAGARLVRRRPRPGDGRRGRRRRGSCRSIGC